MMPTIVCLPDKSVSHTGVSKSSIDLSSDPNQCLLQTQLSTEDYSRALFLTSRNWIKMIFYLYSESRLSQDNLPMQTDEISSNSMFLIFKSRKAMVKVCPISTSVTFFRSCCCCDRRRSIRERHTMIPKGRKLIAPTIEKTVKI